MSKRKAAKRERLRAIAAEAKRHRSAPRKKKRESKLLAPRVRSVPAPDPGVPYRALDVTLVVGDGDFSWSRALAELRGAAGDGGIGLTATCYDCEDGLVRKYGAPAAENISALRAASARVLTGIDATRMHTVDALADLRGRCRYVVFNFPHAGAGIKDEATNTRLHRELIERFLLSAAAMLDHTLPDAEVHVTLKRGRPYSTWNIPALTTPALACNRSFAFDPTVYPGYVHRRTLGPSPLRAEPNADVSKGDGALTHAFRLRS